MTETKLKNSNSKGRPRKKIRPKIFHQKTSQSAIFKNPYNRSFYILLVLFQLYCLEFKFVFANQNSDSTQQAKLDAQTHLEKANNLLGAGQLNDALQHYNSAVELDPNNYAGRYKRATCLLGLGKARAALPDLDKTVELQPGFWQAKLQRAHVYWRSWGKFGVNFRKFGLKSATNCSKTGTIST